MESTRLLIRRMEKEDEASFVSGISTGIPASML